MFTSRMLYCSFPGSTFVDRGEGQGCHSSELNRGAPYPTRNPLASPPRYASIPSLNYFSLHFLFFFFFILSYTGKGTHSYWFLWKHKLKLSFSRGSPDGLFLDHVDLVIQLCYLLIMTTETRQSLMDPSVHGRPPIFKRSASRRATACHLYWEQQMWFSANTHRQLGAIPGSLLIPNLHSLHGLTHIHQLCACYTML